MREFEPRATEDHRWELGRWPDWQLVLLAQPQYGGFRPDFAVVSAYTHDDGFMPFVLFAEVDGHEFHERTPEQAERDRSRDRFMLSTGARVIRFTGREVYRDPDGCAYEIMSHALSMRRRFLDDEFTRFLRREGQYAGAPHG